MALPVDEVLLTLGKDTIRIAEQYEIRAAIMSQPASFALRLGHGGVIAELLSRYPKNTPFELRINGRLMQTGYTDGSATGGDGGAQVTCRGRDVMGRLCSAYAPRDKSFSNLTYHELVSNVLDEVGLQEHLLVGEDAANRKAITGTQIVELDPAHLDIVTKRTGSEIGDGEEGRRKVTQKSITLKVGGRWYDWLKTQLDRAGLFLWASGEGAFMLTVPTAAQKPAYRIERVARGGSARDQIARVVDHDFVDNGQDRFTKMIVYGRGGGRKAGRVKVVGECVDPEMAFFLGGESTRIITVHDNDVKTIAQANHYARRRMAEINREAWKLSYKLAGHSTIGADGNRAVWSPNTVVEVDDQELGIRGLFWIEEVAFNGSPQQTTTVRLMRPDHLFFATEAA